MITKMRQELLALQSKALCSAVRQYCALRSCNASSSTDKRSASRAPDKEDKDFLVPKES